MNLSLDQVREEGLQMSAAIGLNSAPVGVRFVKTGNPVPDDAEPLVRHRYCQALMLARQGASVWLDGINLACPAAAAAFGFRSLPTGLQSGQGLVGFGIVSHPSVGQRMLAEMPTLPPNSIRGIHLFPLMLAPALPDLVVVEDEVENLMWITLAYLHATGGERVQSSTAVLQATCVDCAILPYQEQRLNFSYGCYGCRDATDLGSNEAALGFPYHWLAPVVEHLAFLSRKAMPNARAKQAWAALQRDSGQQGGGQADGQA